MQIVYNTVWPGKNNFQNGCEKNRKEKSDKVKTDNKWQDINVSYHLWGLGWRFIQILLNYIINQLPLQNL